MSRIRANLITNQTANGAPNFTNGLFVTGVATVTNNLNVGGVLTYEDVTNVDSVGIITARSTVSIADSIVHTGDTNTAIRFPSADTFSVETSGSERLRIGSAGQFGLGGANYGTAGQVLVSQGSGSTPTWSGGTTRTLEYITAPCTGESVATARGTRTTQQVSAAQDLTTTFTQITGSEFTYRPPAGTHTVIYRFNAMHSHIDTTGITSLKFFVGGVEIVYARYMLRASGIQGRYVFEWPIRIDSGQADDYNHARLQSWNGDKVLQLQARDYSGTYDAKFHETKNWENSGSFVFSMPTITLIALGT